MFGRKNKRQEIAVVQRLPDEEDEEGEEERYAVEVTLAEEERVSKKAKRSKGPPVRRADEGASCFSRLFFTWFFPLLREGTLREIEQEDLGEVAFAEEPTHIQDRFEKLWANARRRKDGTRRLFGVFLRIIGFQNILLCFVLSVIKATLITALPFVSKALIDSFQEGSELEAGETVLFVCMLIFFPLLATLSDAHLNFIGRRASTHLYETFTLAIYNKSLRLTSAARTQSSTGQ